MGKMVSLECMKCRLRTKFSTRLKNQAGLELFCNTCGASLGLADFVLKKPLTQRWVIFAALIEKKIETGEGCRPGSHMAAAVDACRDWLEEQRNAVPARD
jgi:hypothetical protein